MEPLPPQKGGDEAPPQKTDSNLEANDQETQPQRRPRFPVGVLLCSAIIAFTLSTWGPLSIHRRHHHHAPHLPTSCHPHSHPHVDVGNEEPPYTLRPGNAPAIPTLEDEDEGASSSNHSLAPYAFTPLPLGSIKPLGWQHDQLTLMANGLAGHLYDFYPVIRHSPWLGGHSEYAGLNEGLPYWLNGLVPLAYGLEDERLKGQVRAVVTEVLRRQDKDGWLGPEKGVDRDIWARFPLCLGLVGVAEADEELRDEVVGALHAFVRIMHKMLKKGKAYGTFWGEVRYPDMLFVLQWLFDQHPRGNQKRLLKTMNMLRNQGFDWPGYWTNGSFLFADLDVIKPAIEADTWRFRHSHAVNVGQGLSAGAAIYRFTNNESVLDANRRGVKWTFDYHGDVAGSIIGDERESGLGPNRGSELCTASETMYSLTYLYHVIGDNELADRAELAAFNAWPVSITADHWARQYLAVANDPWASTIWGPLNFWNSGFEALVYGLDTNYPCCTVNMPQGMPKFLSASFVRIGKDGIGHALLGPASVTATTASGVSVNITSDTHYPFGQFLNYNINCSGDFVFYWRRPTWCDEYSSIVINGEEAETAMHTDEQTGMTAIPLYAGTHEVIVDLKPKIRVQHRGNSSVAVYHGALLYALDIGELKDFAANTLSPNVTYNALDGMPAFPSAVKKVEISNTKPWNIGIDPDSLVYHSQDDESALKSPIFDYRAPPSHITAKACTIDWPLKNGLPAALSALPKGQTKRKCRGRLRHVVLRPYASLKVHMAELPVVDLETARDGIDDDDYDDVGEL